MDEGDIKISIKIFYKKTIRFRIGTVRENTVYFAPHL